jgi:hypothetical protein
MGGLKKGLSTSRVSSPAPLSHLSLGQWCERTSCGYVAVEATTLEKIEARAKSTIPRSDIRLPAFSASSAFMCSYTCHTKRKHVSGEASRQLMASVSALVRQKTHVG